MLADSAAPTIEVKARTALRQMLLEPKLGKAWEEYTWSEAAVALETIVRTSPSAGLRRVMPTLMTC